MLSVSKKLSKAQIELSFIRTTRKQSARGLSGTLSRQELFEMVIRMGIQWVKEAYGQKARVCDYLDEFLNIYI